MSKRTPLGERKLAAEIDGAGDAAHIVLQASEPASRPPPVSFSPPKASPISAPDGPIFMSALPPKNGHWRCKKKCLLWAKSGHSVIRLTTSLVTANLSIRQQDGQSCIRQNVLGCPAKYPLPHSALRVGTLD